MAESISVTVNGSPERVPAGCSIADLVTSFGEAHPSLITELDGSFLDPRDYATTRVREGSRIEFIHPAFGG
jgi:thiamine biosynthesis protein ThiS